MRLVVYDVDVQETDNRKLRLAEQASRHRAAQAGRACVNGVIAMSARRDRLQPAAEPTAPLVCLVCRTSSVRRGPAKGTHGGWVRHLCCGSPACDWSMASQVPYRCAASKQPFFTPLPSAGEAAFVLSDLLTAPGQSLTLPLKDSHNRPLPGCIVTLSAEELPNTNAVVTLALAAQRLDNKDTFSKSDPFVKICKARESGAWAPVVKTEVRWGVLALKPGLACCECPPVLCCLPGGHRPQLWPTASTSEAAVSRTFRWSTTTSTPPGVRCASPWPPSVTAMRPGRC